MQQALYWEDNRLFLENGLIYGVYRLPRLPYEHQPEAMKRSIFRQLEVLFLTYHGKGQILDLSRPMSAPHLAASMAEYSRHPYWQSHIDLTSKVLEHIEAYERVVYLLLPLASSYHVAWDAVLDRPDLFSQRIGDQVKRFLHYGQRKAKGKRGIPVLTQAELRSARQANMRMLNRLQALIPGLVEAFPQDIEFIYRSPYYRGLSPIPLLLSDSLPKTLTVLNDEVILQPHPLHLSLHSATVYEDTFRLRIKHDNNKVSYQSLLAISALPERTELIGDEWLYQPLEKLDFPLDACIQFEVLAPRRAREVVYRKKKIITAQEEEYAQTGDVPWDVYDGMEDAQGLEMKLKSGNTLIQLHGFFALGASSEAEMLRRETELKQKLQGTIQLVHPPGEALRIWQTFFPGEDHGAERSWQIPCDPQMLAGSGLLGTIEVGDPKGMWYAKLLHNGRPVFVNWYRPMHELNRSGAAAFVGTLGSGKSVGMKYGADTMLQWGAIGAVVDPKQGEYGSLVQLWPKESVWWQFGADTKLSFTPFRLGQNARESKVIADGFLSVLLNVTTRRDDQRAMLVLNRALNTMYGDNAWDMFHYLRALNMERENSNRKPQEREDADLFYQILSGYQEHEFGHVLFGEDGSENTMNSQSKLVVASIMGLDFPEPGSAPDAWRESQRFAVSILYLVTQIAFRKLVMAPSNVKKFMLIDESWTLRSIPEGRALLNRMLLLGRSMNLVLMLAAQNPDVFLASGQENDDIAANLGWIFAGRITSKTQVKNAVRLLGLPEEENLDRYVEKFQSFYGGRGYLRDPLGRIGEVQIDVLDTQLLKAFSTTPESK